MMRTIGRTADSRIGENPIWRDERPLKIHIQPHELKRFVEADES